MMVKAAPVGGLFHRGPALRCRLLGTKHTWLLSRRMSAFGMKNRLAHQAARSLEMTQAGIAGRRALVRMFLLPRRAEGGNSAGYFLSNSR